jgi:hypothetical protein
MFEMGRGQCGVLVNDVRCREKADGWIKEGYVLVENSRRREVER